MFSTHQIQLMLTIIVLTLCASIHATTNITGERKNDTITPVVMWHGMGDSCCFSFSLGRIKETIEDNINGVYVKSIKIGDSLATDVSNGYFKPANEQIDMVCDEIQKDDRLKNGFHAIGFSQGAQFLRGLVQKCNVTVFNLISLGGQHQGVYGLPNCASMSHKSCDYLRSLLNKGAYWRWVQQRLVQASYWHDPLNESKYRKGSIFLADLNNENEINETYIERLKRLKKFVLVKFTQDSMVQPVDTEWFGFYAPGQSKLVLPLEETHLYTEDRLGLRSMKEHNQIDYLAVDGDHLRFTTEWFADNIIEKYLR